MTFVTTCRQGDFEKKHSVFIYRTGDNAKTWTIIRVSVPDADLSLILGGTRILNISPSVIWLWAGKDSTSQKQYQSVDGGYTWKELKQFADVDIVQIIDQNNLWAIGKSGELLRTRDAGTTWTVVYPRADFTSLPEYPDCRVG